MSRRRPPESNRWRDARRAAAKAAKAAGKRLDAQLVFPGWSATLRQPEPSHAACRAEAAT